MSDPLSPKIPAPNDDRTDPLMLRASIVAVATAVLGLLVSGKVIALTDLQRDLLLTIVGTAATMLAAWWARHHVYSPASVRTLLAAKKSDAIR